MSYRFLDVDNIIKALLAVKGTQPIKFVRLNEKDITTLCLKARQIFLNQPIVLEITAPVNICGDIHGQYNDLLRCFDLGGYPPLFNYLFLGDYIDRGTHSVETICLLFAYKLKYPDGVFLLRGNHECNGISRMYGFYDECKRRYNSKLWKTFVDCFNCMPIVGIINNKIFCCHGGLSPELNNVQQIRELGRPTDIPECGLLCDLLWADPDPDITGWNGNDRGLSFVFGRNVLNDFLKKNKYKLLVRAHQVVDNGYQFLFNNQLVTIFSAPNYCDEYDNAGAVMVVDVDLKYSFHTLQPKVLQKESPQQNDTASNPVQNPLKK